MTVLETLLSRRSIPAQCLTEPGPDAAQLAVALDVAMRAPDHGRMQAWRFKLIRGEAKARFSSFVDDAIAGERVTVTRHGRPVAVIVSAAEWERGSEKLPSFADLLLSFPGFPKGVPLRSRKPMRDVDL